MCKKVSKKDKSEGGQQQLLQMMVGALAQQVQQLKTQQAFQAGIQQGAQASMMQGRMGMGGIGMNRFSASSMQMGAGGVSLSQTSMSFGGFPGIGSSNYFSSSFQSFGGSASMMGGVSAGFSQVAMSRSLMF